MGILSIQMCLHIISDSESMTSTLIRTSDTEDGSQSFILFGIGLDPQTLHL